MPQPATTALFQAATSAFESLSLLFAEPGSADGAAFIFRVRVGERQAGFARLQMDEGQALLALFTRDAAAADA